MYEIKKNVKNNKCCGKITDNLFFEYFILLYFIILIK